MGGIDVASVVTSIISAFGSGLDIFHRLSGKKRRNKARLPRPAEEEEWLRHSLSNRPVEIRHEFDRQVAKYGHRFELGDGQAQSSLAHTLLVLNTGLINLINRALSNDSKTASASKRTLYGLSETAATDTMAALAQLSSRLNLASPSRLALESKEKRRVSDKHDHRERHSTPAAIPKQVNRPPPTPLLVRGGWVRSKSGSSVVSGASARKARTEHGDKHQRSRSDSAIMKSASRSPDRHKAKRDEKAEHGSDLGWKRIDRSTHGIKTSSRHKSEEHLRPQRQPSMLLVPADFFNGVEYITEKTMPEEAPPRPPKIPLHSRPAQPQGRTRPTSTMTFMTASTKIGEIPESRFQSKEEVQSRPMPYTIPPPLEPIEPRKRKGFKFWKREDKRQDVAAY
ncbi:hypothetical protein H2200_001359 [Cladophialophora chaetospira]|uniref:Uncharacterized protein n=1 Tax=Cladophialophora chaetospira TaxID=386627 RepID=A0AA38XKQ2_9EURO|nr:hypothetical protein H2200_001359 [Cladophialophora chaetospira]